jgi:hypothetical protein
MPEIKFDTGLVTYTLNSKCEVSFNPTDTAFVEKLYNTFNSLDEKQNAYTAEIESLSGKREIFDYARERDTEMRSMIDDVLGDGVSEAVFGKMNVYSLADGLPVWCNLMLAVMDEIDTSFAREQKKTNPRVAKYTAKYNNAKSKYHK